MLNRFFTFLPLILVTVALSACSGSSGKGKPGAGDGASGAYGDAANIKGGNLGNITPGTQEDLVANIGDRVFFSFNSSAITENGQKTLRRQADWLKNNPNVTVTIEGHCDERGTREYNLALGDQRANAVRNYLIGLGVDSSRITTISYGKEHPEYLGSNEVAWSKNRRAVTVAN